MLLGCHNLCITPSLPWEILGRGLVFLRIQLRRGVFVLNRYQLPDAPRISEVDVLPEPNLYDTSKIQGIPTYDAFPKTSTNLCAIFL